MPSVTEQQAIVKYVTEQCGELDSAVARARRQIDLLQEYHTRLIADVVTGKLDVREAAARLPKGAGAGTQHYLGTRSNRLERHSKIQG